MYIYIYIYIYIYMRAPEELSNIGAAQRDPTPDIRFNQ